eukprot:TRINITY_DN6130_c0_g2_i1.p1 TRINITY_DN6130_c0_g2~~TRINITY_DN6130_c0_g2_i1.p1  ORF type:complete len:798 (-),score=142.68 TRINITY_DN6130_c0_g2_i1:47-2440(-)
MTDVASLSPYLSDALKNWPRGTLAPSEVIEFWSSLGNTAQKNSSFLSLLLTKCISVLSGDGEEFVEVVRKLVKNGLGNVRVANYDDLSVFSNTLRLVLSTAFYLGLFYPINYEHINLVYIKNRLSEFFVSLQNWTARTDDFSFMQFELLRLFDEGYHSSQDNFEFYLHQRVTDPVPRNVSFNKLEHRFVCLSYIDEYIRMRIFAEKDAHLFMRELSNKINHPSLDEDKIPVILDMFNTYLTTCTFDISDILQDVKKNIRKFLLWPRPICYVAKKTLKAIDKELKFTNYSTIKQMLKENPSLLNPSSSATKIYLFLDSNEPNSELLLSNINSYEPHIHDNFVMQMKIIEDVFNKADINLDGVDLRNIEPTELQNLFQEMIDIMENVAEMDFESSQEAKLRLLSELSDKFKVSQTETMHYDFPLPSFKFQHLQFECIWIDSSRPSTTRKNTYNTEQVFLEPEELKDVENLLEQELSLAHGKREVKFVVCGNSATLSVLSRIFLGLYFNHPEYFELLDVKIYILPMSNACGISKYQAYSDCTYGSRIFSAMPALFSLIPTIGIANPGVNSEPAAPLTENKFSYFDGYPPSIGLMSRNIIENFVRDAQAPLPINLYSCTFEYAYNASENGTIYFCDLIDIGINASATAYRMNNIEHQALSDEEIQNLRDFKFTGTQLVLKYKYVTLSGTLSGFRQDSKNFKAIKIANLPLSSYNSAAHPSLTSLELIVDEESKRREEPRGYYVGHVEIECDEKTASFDAIVDGVHYKDIRRLIISKPSSSKPSSKMNVMGFIPIDTPYTQV